MLTVVTVVAWSVCAYLLVTSLSCAKMAEPIETPFGVWKCRAQGPCITSLHKRGTFRRHTITLLLLIHPFNGLFSRTTWVSQYEKGKTSLDLNEAIDDGVRGCSGISWTMCKQSAPRSRQITERTPHHSIFTGRMLFLTSNQQCQSTERTILSQHNYNYNTI